MEHPNFFWHPQWKISIQDIQYFSSVPVLHSLQVVLFLKFLNVFHEYLKQQSLKLWGTNYHFKWVKVPGTTPYWKACLFLFSSCMLCLIWYHRSGFKIYNLGLDCTTLPPSLHFGARKMNLANIFFKCEYTCAPLVTFSTMYMQKLTTV